MAWEDDKQNAPDPDDPAANEVLDATDWNNHVEEGHFDPSNMRLGSDGSGNPVLRDPQNGDAIVATYDRSAGSWVLESLQTEELSLKGQRTETRDLTGYDEDTDGSSDLDLSVPVSTENPTEMEFVVVVDGQASGATNPVNIRLNGYTGGYSQNGLSSRTITGETGLSEWYYEVFDNQERRERFSLVNTSGQGEISQITGNYQSRTSILNGHTPAGSSIDPLNNIDIFTPFNATGRAYVIEIGDS